MQQDLGQTLALDSHPHCNAYQIQNLHKPQTALILSKKHEGAQPDGILNH